MSYFRQIFLVLCGLQCGFGQVLTPPYFNLAQGRRIVASSTCGEDVPEPELFCKLVGANAEGDNIIIQGQICDRCDPQSDSKRHPARYAVDGRETWWQSPPLSRGEQYNEVNLTIELGQEFHVAYVIIKMGNSPRPGVWALERSNDNGQTYFPWQYFADNFGECIKYFGNVSSTITADDSVICDIQNSKIVPLEGGEIVVPLVKGRPSENDFFNSTILQEWTRATNVRFRLLRVKNLLGHLMSVANRDPTTTRRYFYSIKDISIGGRCRCNGHAETCSEADQNDPNKLICDCKDNTCGHNCETCCPGYEQKKWSQSKTNKKFVCERCNCFGHSDQCQYNETVDQMKLSLDIHGSYDGGGVCQNCQHNTEGINCHKCINGYFRPHGKLLNETDVCQPCQCDLTYSTGNCEDGTGKCECKPEYLKPNCDDCSFGYYGYPLCRPCECYPKATSTQQCNPQNGKCSCKSNYGGDFCRNCTDGFYNWPECRTCDCNEAGSLSSICNVQNGDCKCKSNYAGRTCDQCNDGYYQFPSCLYCNCEVKGTLGEICNKTNGQCLCKPGYGGSRCDQCLAGYTGFPDCKPCNCSTYGSVFSVCDITGKCICQSNFAGKLCDQCAPGYYQAPTCLPCGCFVVGTDGVSCNNEGACPCKQNFAGEKCDRCGEGYYNYPVCEECKFNPAGVKSTFAGCSSLKPGELVDCKSNVQGRICGECKDLYWNLQAGNNQGCEECSCSRSGTIGRLGTCESKTGQCTCKPSVSSRKCDQCIDGWYNLTDSNIFGCSDCGCDPGGSHSSTCNKQTGQCSCLPRIGGRNCKEPLGLQYYPTLHQYQYEVEDGRTPSFTPVRYGFNDKVFPGYSWKGYAVFSHLQNETVHAVVIDKPSLYRVVLRYVNLNAEAITGTISAIPEYSNDIDAEQKNQVVFKPSSAPAFVTVAGVLGNKPLPFVLNPGPWIIKIKNEKSLFLDYFVLIPEDYYEGSALVVNVTTPCTLEKTDLCRLYLYPNISDFDQVKGLGAYKNMGDNRSPVQEFYDDLEQPLGIPKMPKLSKTQSELYFNLRLSRPGEYVLVVNYGTVPNQDTSTVQVQVSTQEKSFKGGLTIYPCRYRTLCRQVVSDKEGRVSVFKFEANNVNIILKGSGEGVGIDSVVAIPQDEWSLDYVQPKPSCVINDTKCVPSLYPLPPDSKQFDFKTGNENRISRTQPSSVIANNTELVYLDENDAMIDITGKVPKPGPYAFVVHYYQPNLPDYDGDVIIHNGQFYEAKIRYRHCPSVSGCRSAIKQQNGNSVFYLTENFVLTLKVPPKKGVWVQYALLIPNRYTNEMINELPFDQTQMFISKCGQNHFYLNTSEEGFCKEAAFTLTTKYNLGALYCQCDWDGALNFACEKFGGQCPCRENVIGRRCDNCKTGYFGFPNCKSCNCSSTAVCDPNTGECICPQNVIGEKCNQCSAYTYGFDPIIGCEDCNCHVHGVENNDLQCDLFTGACKCKKNIEGRTCDRCVAGFFAFPYCDKCTCDLRGTTEEICNQTNAACLCKAHVQGAACDVCKDGTFNLQRDEPSGCTKCFCFGKTPRCISSTLYLSQITSYQNWTLANAVVGDKFETNALPTQVNEIGGGISVNMAYVLEGSAYFVAPPVFLGNKLTAYGAFFNYTIRYSASSDTAHAVGGPDLVLYGANTYIYYTSVSQPDKNQYFPIFVKMVETEFTSLTSDKVTREEFMQILQNLTAIYIKASYVDKGDITEVVGIAMEVGLQEYNPGSTAIALSVEQCQCPPNYVGLSCEECADGYYRVSTGQFGGNCIPCQCNGHATTCDKTTGVCIDCKYNTKGDHCEKCETGYYGNATGGLPTDCLICACPQPIKSNNFATGCDVNEAGDRIVCECIEGYTGDHCERCAPGYYGDPNVAGSTCVPCECNGNINSTEVNSCDPLTGKCLKCLNHTSGDSCEKCAPGFYGDAIVAKDCQACNCDTCGMKECDHHTGRCICHENIVGEKCDKCADNHYGFTTCTGCRACNCAVASLSSQCDDLTGYCRCKDGVVGQTCEKCAAGYWKYSEQGCTSCGCNIGYSIGVGCNTTTGLCQCLPGVVGDKCDKCPYRWVLIPEEGCSACDNCTDGLLDVTDQLRKDLEPVKNKFKENADGHFTGIRLAYYNNTANDLAPNVTDVLSYQFDLAPYENKINALKKDKETSLRKIQSVHNDLESSQKKGASAIMDALKMELLISNVVDASETTVHNINDLVFNLENGAGPRTDHAILDANRTLQQIYRSEIDEDKRTEAENVLNKAQDILKRVHEFGAPMNRTAESLEVVQKNADNLMNKLDELENFALKAQELIVNASNDNQSNKKAKLIDRINTFNDAVKETEIVIANASTYLQNTGDILGKNKVIQDELTENLSKLKSVKEKADENLQTLSNGINGVRESVFNAKSHAKELEKQAETLNSIIKSQVSADHAVRAANSYKDIVTALDDASSNSSAAKTASDSVAEKLKGFENKVSESNIKSSELINQARKALEDVQQTLAPELTTTLQKQNAASKGINQTAELLEGLKKSIEKQKREVKQLGNLDVDDVSTKATELQGNTKDIAEELPKKLANAKDLYSKLDDTNKKAQQVDNYLNRFDSLNPDISAGIAKIKPKLTEQNTKEKNIDEMLNSLKQKISITRDMAAKVKVGVTLNQNTAIELPLPASMIEQGASNDISLHFRTTDPNGLLFYVGNPKAPRAKRETAQKARKPKTEDFLGLEIVNGYLVLIANLGEKEDTELVLRSRSIVDDKWYKVVIQRTAKTVNLTLYIQEAPQTPIIDTLSVAGSFPGQSSVLNLDKDQSKFFIGGLPQSFEPPRPINTPKFNGKVEEVLVDRVPIGLWNFISVYASQPNVPVKNLITGAVERDVLTSKTTLKGCRISEGYVLFKPYSISLVEKANILLKFKTMASNGLLFLVQKDGKFISIELRRGFIYFQYNVGKGLKSFHSPTQYNDDQWHEVYASRTSSKSHLEIDSAVIRSEMSGDKQGEMGVPEYIYLGGYAGDHKLNDVIKEPFDGCIDGVQVNDIILNMNNNLNSRGIVPGCPDKFVRYIELEEGSQKYIHWSGSKIPEKDWSKEYPLYFTIRFKTLIKYGLIAYGALGSDSFYLTLVNGSVVFKVGKTEVTTGPNAKYNDDRWHSVMAFHTGSNGNVLQLVLDDFDIFKSEEVAPAVQFVGLSLYLGSAPSNVDAAAAVERPFVGSLGDATLNGVVVNFERTFDRDKPLEVASSPAPNLETTTLAAVTTPTPPVTVAPGCLPLVPASDPDLNEESGYRFGTAKNGFFGYELDETLVKGKLEFAFELKTVSTDGLIFYVTEPSHNDYVALYIKESMLHYSFKCASNHGNVTSEKSINEGEWHMIEFSINQNQGLLKVDTITQTTSIGCAQFNVRSLYYVGGVDVPTLDAVTMHLNGFNKSFVGCLKNFKANGVIQKKPSTSIGVIPCSSKVESGTFFSAGGGYLKTFDQFQVGKEKEIYLEFKPRNLSGILFGVHGKKHYMILQMIDGAIKFTVDHGAGPFSTVFKPSNSTYFCDNKWHTIKALKSKTLAILTVDGDGLPFGSDPGFIKETKTRSPLYVGGYPADLSKAPGVETSARFVGCIKRFQIDGKDYDLSSFTPYGDVVLNVCPNI